MRAKKTSAKVVQLDKYRKRGKKAWLVPASELDPKKGLRAKDYLRDTQGAQPDDPADPKTGRSRVASEINVLKWAKAWKRYTMRRIKASGFGDLKSYFANRPWYEKSEKQLLLAIEALEEWEKSNK